MMDIYCISKEIVYIIDESINFVCRTSSIMTSLYARRMARLSARIFGDVFRPTTSQSMKVVQLMSEKPREHRREVVEYYPPHNEVYKLMKTLRYLGLYR